MPRYHFHCANGSRESDHDGTELADDETAQQMAVVFAGEVLKSDPKEIWNSGSWRVEVTDPDNVLLFTVITLAVDAPRPEAKMLDA